MDLIERQAAIDAMCSACGYDCDKSEFVYNAPQDEQIILCPEHYALTSLPSAQPEPHYDEWCNDCKEYDKEQHCCPRWNKVIRETLKDAQPEQRWIPCSERLPIYGESVLTWDGVAYCVEKRIPYIRDERGEPIYSDWWVSDDYDEFDSEYYPNLRDGACVAWCELPEVYREKGGKDETD